MPLVTLESVNELLPQALRTVLASDDRFAKVETQASIIVRDETNIEIPGAEEDAPDWVVTPMAWLIAYLSLPYFNNASEELRKTVQDNYERALSLLRKHKVAPTPNASKGRFGTITGGWNRG